MSGEGIPGQETHEGVGRTVLEIKELQDSFMFEEGEIYKELNEFWKQTVINTESVSEEDLTVKLADIRSKKDGLSARILSENEKMTEQEKRLHDAICYLHAAQQTLKEITDLNEDKLIELENNFNSPDPEDLPERAIHIEMTVAQYRAKLQSVVDRISKARSNSDIGGLDLIEKGEVYLKEESPEKSNDIYTQSSLDMKHYALYFPSLIDGRRMRTDFYESEDEKVEDYKAKLKDFQDFVLGNEPREDSLHSYWGANVIDEIVIEEIDNPGILAKIGITLLELAKLKKDLIIKKHKQQIGWKKDAIEEDLPHYRQSNPRYLVNEIKKDVAIGLVSYEELGTNEAELDGLITAYEEKTGKKRDL